MYFLLLRVVFLRLRVAEEFLFISARRRAYHLYIYGFHSLLIIILLSQPTSAISTYPLAFL